MRRIRQEHLGQLVMYIYEQAIAQRPVAQVLRELRLDLAAQVNFAVSFYTISMSFSRIIVLFCKDLVDKLSKFGGKMDQ